MGIPRLTQDLRPYLERCIITSGAVDDCEVRIVKLVIDGPSLVYHVYNKLASYKLTSGSGASPCDQPSYAQLTAAIHCFLSDLEFCGAEIQHIYFDGGLPLAKRPVRLGRLEKSRAQLQFRRLANPILNHQRSENHLPNVGAVREALWHSRTSATVASTNLAAPFIVPAAIEHLKASKWASAISVVPGEAEAFCVPAATKFDAAILTNDSDFVLFEDLASNGSVVLLNSMSLTAIGETRNIEAQCWRPCQIAEKLEVDNLLGLGFERSKDSTTSFGAIRQRTKDSMSTTGNDPNFKAFIAQFTGLSGLPGSSGSSGSPVELVFSISLIDFDPRLAELVCQFVEQSLATKQRDLLNFQLTLPILLEDPTRDSSWSYGRDLRHAAYCLLYLHEQKLAKAPDAVRTLTHSTTVSELSRKGPRITEDILPLTPSIQPISSAKEHMQQLSGHLIAANASTSPLLTTAAYILWALHAVLHQRLAAGKQSYSRNLIEQYISLAPLSSERSQKPRANLTISEDANGWTLLHLNANVQAVLHSARTLKQAVDSVKQDRRHDQAGFEAESVKLAEALDTMPPIQDLFLDPNGMRTLLQQVPQDKLKEMIRPMFHDAGWSFDFVTDTSRNNLVEAETVINRKSKKRKKARTEHDKHSATATKFESTNPFDLLMQ